MHFEAALMASRVGMGEGTRVVDVGGTGETGGVWLKGGESEALSNHGKGLFWRKRGRS